MVMSTSILDSQTELRNPLQEDSQSGNRVKISSIARSRKRKARDDNAHNEALGDIITIHPFNPSDNGRRVLRPIRVIDRSALPLSYLQFGASSTSDVPLFSSYIWSLEREEQEGNGSKILIVQEEGNHLAAVERVSRGIYAVCPLASWVGMSDFGQKAAKHPRIQAKYTKPPRGLNNEWWAEASIAPSKPEESGKRLLDFVLADRPQANKLVQHSTPKKITPTLVETLETPKPVLQHESEQVEIKDWLQTIRQHYLDALYTSRAPVAYFIKGPLSRARAASQLSATTGDLINLLKGNVLPVKFKSNAAVIDKKYGQAVPNMIDQIPSGMTLEDGHDLGGSLKDRIAKSRRRKKINSDGFLAGEEECILHWWIRRETDTSHEGLSDTREKRLKQAMMEQKMRETQLQIIIILEALALEKHVADSLHKDILSSHQQIDSTNTETMVAKKPQDLTKTLDVLVEKLQIWETMTDELAPVSATNNGGIDAQSNTCLRSFCLDVVLPFFSSRIPEVSKTMCQKFGIPVSPEKKLTRSISLHQSSTRPGDSLKERRSHHSLTRVCTDELSVSKRRAPSLVRSATDSLIPNLKHELDEVSLSTIPKQRTSITQSKLYARREVDLTAEFKATEAKLKRKAQVEKELKGAIFALKKPNARLAVQEYVDASDQRNVSQKSRSRKSQNPVRNPFATGVQVTATPRAKRYQPRPMIESKLQSSPEGTRLAVVPPSSAPRVPASTVKIRVAQSGFPSRAAISSTPSKASKPFQSSFQVTPSRGQNGLAMINLAFAREEEDESGSEPELPPMLPPKTREQDRIKTDKVAATPCKLANSNRQITTSEATPSFVYSTPGKNASEGEIVLHTSPVQQYKAPEMSLCVKQSESITNDVSIYDALGWDNDFNDM